jgi:hypothetical protein
MANPRIISTPKSYYVTRRIDGHSQWQFAFWRELFQNAVDAGAKRVDISIEDAIGRGSFGRDPNLENVVRIKFKDSGRGMSRDVLENVFFRPGETTKKDATTTGGFGTARLMVCFSQVRYSVRTNDLVVEGDGSEYTVMTRNEALETLQTEMLQAVGSAQSAVLQAALQDLQNTPVVEGCEFEIDLDPKEERSYPKPTRSYMEQQLSKYLSMSQLPCKVYLNGQEMVEKIVRGPARRTLMAKLGDEEFAFATAHVSTTDKAAYKGKMLVRSNGALMFVRESWSTQGTQIIIEIDPSRARTILNENRDGLRNPYNQIIEDFQRDLIIDNKSAMRDDGSHRHSIIRGQLGLLNLARRKRATPDPVENVDDGAMEFGAIQPRRSSGSFSSVRTGPIEIPELTDDQVYQVMIDIYGRRAEGYPTFFDEYPNQYHVSSCADLIIDRSRIAETRQYGEFMAFATKRIREVGGEPSPNMSPIDGLHDIHIQTNDPSKDVRKTIFKYYPHNWRQAGDKPAQGVYAHSLLAAWNVAVGHAVNTLLTVLPTGSVDLPIKVATGFYFSKNDDVKIGSEWTSYRAGAVHQKIGKLHLLLINPVYNDGTSTFDLGQDSTDGTDWGMNSTKMKQGLQKIAALAIHEAGHILERTHNESFASILTEIQASARMDVMLDDMKLAIEDTRRLYMKPKEQFRVDRKTEPALPQMSMRF